jgi:hypothetical protein
MKTSDFINTLAKAVAIGFLTGFLSVVVAAMVAINDPTIQVPLEVHFAIWLVAAIVALMVMVLRRRRGK